MANFFKTYQSELRHSMHSLSDNTSNIEDLCKYLDCLNKGDKVKVDKAYCKRGYLFFGSRFSEDSVILHESKAKAQEGKGYLYDINVIVK